MNHYHTPNKKFFNWIYDRLVYVHGEDPDYDYIQSLRERIDELFNDETAKRKEESEMKHYDIDKLKAKIEAKFNDNLKAEEKSRAGFFGAAAKEDYDILALIEEMEENI